MTLITADEAELNEFRMAREHVLGGQGKRTFSSSDGWAMVRSKRLVELEIKEETLEALKQGVTQP